MNLTTEICTQVIAVWMLNGVGLYHRGGDKSAFLLMKPSLCSPGGQVRYRREHASGRQLPFFPLLEDLMRDICDGAALLTVVHSYCPDHMKLEGMLIPNTAVFSRYHL